MPGREETEMSSSASSSKQYIPRQREVYGFNDEAMSRYHDIHLPKCHECLRRWPFPREVSFMCGIPEDIHKTRTLTLFEPVTKECIVPYQTWDRGKNEPHLREEIFARLKLTHTLTANRCLKRGRLQFHRLVQEFDYNRKTGDVTHSGEFFSEDQEDDFRYARLVTLNGWYRTLLQNILHMVVDVFNLASGAMMIAQLFSEYGGFQDVEYVKQSRIWYTAWFGFAVLMAFVIAAQAAYWEWKVTSSPAVGDLISRCHPIDRTLTFFAMVIFNFFGVDKTIKDAPVILHPWKSVQPYAAVKVEGTRVHVVGYKSRPLFNVENASGQFHVLLMLALSKLISFIYKVSIVVAINYENFQCRQEAKRLPVPPPCTNKTHSPDVNDSLGQQISYQSTLLLSTLAALLSTVLVLKKVIQLQQQRRLLKIELLRVLETAHKKGDTSRLGPAQKLLALHFSLEYKDGGIHKAKVSNFMKGDDNKCGRCGRAYENLDFPSFSVDEQRSLNIQDQKKVQLIW